MTQAEFDQRVRNEIRRQMAAAFVKSYDRVHALLTDVGYSYYMADEIVAGAQAGNTIDIRFVRTAFHSRRSL